MFTDRNPGGGGAPGYPRDKPTEWEKQLPWVGESGTKTLKAGERKKRPFVLKAEKTDVTSPDYEKKGRKQKPLEVKGLL